MKKFLMTVVFILSFSALAYAGEEISLNIDGKPIESDIPPQIIDGRTMVPVRAIFESVGAAVDWDAETKTINGKLGSMTVTMAIDSDIVTVNGKPTQMDCSPVIIDGRTLAPARYVAESFGCEVDWDGENKVVNISSPLGLFGKRVDENNGAAEAESVTEESTEATTAETTETTTHPMNAYKTFYKPGTYEVGKDIPEGEYVVFANPDSIGYLYKYAKDGTTTAESGKRYIYNNYFSYNDVITLSKKNYLDLSAAYAVPTDEVKSLDLSKNGTFRAGKDINTGHYTFKRSPESPIAFVDVGYVNDGEAARTISYLYEDDAESVVINVTGGMLIRTFGCDIYDGSLRLVKAYEPVTTNIKNTDASLKLSDVSVGFKNEVDSYMLTLCEGMDPLSLNSTKFTSSYQKKMFNEWTGKAANAAEKKYASLAENFYTHIRDCAANTKGELVNSNSISFRGRTITTGQFRHMLEAQKDFFTDAIKDFANSGSFQDIECAVFRAAQYRHDVPRLTGSGR